MSEKLKFIIFDNTERKIPNTVEGILLFTIAMKITYVSNDLTDTFERRVKTPLEEHEERLQLAGLKPPFIYRTTVNITEHNNLPIQLKREPFTYVYFGFASIEQAINDCPNATCVVAENSEQLESLFADAIEKRKDYLFRHGSTMKNFRPIEAHIF